MRIVSCRAAATLILLSFFATPFLARPALADCGKLQHAPEMPQGATATDEEMKEGHDKLQAFVHTLEAYQKCMEKQAKDAPPDTKPEVKQAWLANGDAAIDIAQQLAEIYSAQLRAFKARQ